MPYGTNGIVTESLRAMLRAEIARRPVYIGSELPELDREFVFRRISGPEELYRMEKR
jgi:hypothetical protein